MANILEKAHMENFLLRDGHNFVIGTTGGLFFPFAVFTNVQHMRYSGENAAGSSSNRVSAQTAGTPGTKDFFVPKADPGTTQDMRFLYFTNNTQIWQVFREYNEPDLRIFQKIPKGAAIQGLGNEFQTPSLTDNYGWDHLGKDSPMGYPTVYSMFFLLPGNDIELAFANPTEEAVQVLIDFTINIIEFGIWDPRDQKDRNKIVNMLRNRIPKLMWKPNMTGYQYSAQLRKETFYDVPPVQWDGHNAWYLDAKRNKVVIL